MKSDYNVAGGFESEREGWKAIEVVGNRLEPNSIQIVKKSVCREEMRSIITANVCRIYIMVMSGGWECLLEMLFEIFQQLIFLGDDRQSGPKIF